MVREYSPFCLFYSILFMEKLIIKEYEIPQVEIIEVKVEYGYANSGNDGGMSLPGWEII